MRCQYQRGELGLLKAAIFIGTVAFAGMLALLSARYERNLFADLWQRVKAHDAGKLLLQVQRHAQGPATVGTTSETRRCMIDGRVVYSNVECGNGPGSSKVELVATRGIEPPKSQPVVNLEGPETQQDKVLDKMLHPGSNPGTRD